MTESGQIWTFWNSFTEKRVEVSSKHDIITIITGKKKELQFKWKSFLIKIPSVFSVPHNPFYV